jgi:dephospho-CoA kinase
MIIIGITGSMAMGKSTLVQLLKKQGNFPVMEADAEIKRLYAMPHVQQQLILLRPNLVKDQIVQRGNLMSFILENPYHLLHLESILYPELAKVRQKFLQKCQTLQMKLVFLDIPLLIEKQMQHLCDYIIVVNCPQWLQQKRLEERDQKSQKLRELLMQQQMPSLQKMKQADFVVQTGLNKRYIVQQLQTILRKINE